MKDKSQAEKAAAERQVELLSSALGNIQLATRLSLCGQE